MMDELLRYYEEELRFIRGSTGEFARERPKTAERLQLNAGDVEDPHVRRLIEAFAFLNARTRHRLDDDFPEITSAFLDVLCPHYLAPYPSACVVEFGLDRGLAEKLDGLQIGAHEPLETEPIDGEPCRFSTCYPVELWPIEVASASLQHPPFEAPQCKFSGNAESVLKVQIKTYVPAVSFAKLRMSKLRFYVNSKAPDNYRLFDLLRTSLTGIAVANSPTDKSVTTIEARHLQPVGLSPAEGLLHKPTVRSAGAPATDEAQAAALARSFAGHRLLCEFFALPQKFLFLDVELPAGSLRNIGSNLEIYFYLSRPDPDLVQGVDAGSLRLGCTPIVNLYRQAAEPVPLNHAVSEYRVVPDSRRPLAHEVYSIERVTAVSRDLETMEFQPFYSSKHGVDLRRQRTFWHAARRPAPPKEGQTDKGTEVFLSLVDLEFKPSVPQDWTLHIDTICINRDLPGRLPYGPKQPALHFSSGSALARVHCLSRPTDTVRPNLGNGVRWKLISQLALNHLSLVDSPASAEALREILQLNSLDRKAANQKIIAGLTGVHSERTVGRITERIHGQNRTAVCRGLLITLLFEESQYTESSFVLFASVLERFLSWSCTLNSFVKTVARGDRHEGNVIEWPARSGESVLL